MIKKTLKRTVILLLEKEAQAVLRKYKPKIVAITGSVGKTSTKDATYTALSRFYNCRKSQKSQNSDIGIPLSILNIPNAGSNFLLWLKNLINGLVLILLPHYYPEWLVLEVGADTPGDIEKVSRWLKPDIVVVTKLSKVPVHVEFFSSPEEIFKEKGNLVKVLKPGGTLILNADDSDVMAFRELTKEKVVLFGESSSADVSAQNYEVIYDENNLPLGASFVVLGGDEALPIYLEGTVGKHHVYHILSALAVCKALGEPLSVAIKNFKYHEPTPGRMRLIEGEKGSIIIDDSYNSSPIALSEALNTLKDLKNTGRKIAVLGDMLELGKYSVEEHKKAGAKAGEIADILVTVGVRARYFAEGAQSAGMEEGNIFQFSDSKKAGEFMYNRIEKGDVVLVKGSQSGIRMERVVEKIMAHPEDKEKLLVRQDKEWRGRK
ncbi:MAG: UDP-N-acetylmuramoyl-tripeptide--D-alanyl-D-alanine ligase [Minisyncoccota bacterium]